MTAILFKPLLYCYILSASLLGVRPNVSPIFSTVQTPLLRGGALDGAEAGVCPFPGLFTKGHAPDPSQEGKRDGNTVMSSVFSTVQTPLLRGGALDGAEAGVCPLPGLLTKGHTPDPSQEGKRDGNTVVSSVFYTVQTPLLRGGALDGAEAGVCPFPDLFTKGHTPDPSQEGKRDGNGLSIFEDNIITLHPLHVSTSDISYNAKDGNLEVILSIYTDDFENAITKLYHTKTDLVKPELHTAMDALVKKYVAANLHIKAGNVDYPLNYVGFEINREAVNVYVETAKLVTPPKKIDVEVSLLHNLYNDQINIVHMTVAGVRKSGKLIFPDKAIGQVF